MSNIFVYGASYDREQIDNIIEKIFESSGIDFNGIKTAAVKPNLLMARSCDKFTTTHPLIVGGVVRALLKRGISDIKVFDCPGGPHSKTLIKTVYKATGMTDEVGEYLYYPEETVTVQSDGHVFNVTSAVKSDIVINLPKLKTHTLTGLSCAVKNIFGVVLGLQKSRLHYEAGSLENFSKHIVNLCKAVSPTLNIVDGIECMEGDGPSAGSKKDMGIILASTDPYTLDSAICDLIGMGAEQALTVAASGELIQKYNVLGESEKFIKTQFVLPRTALDNASKLKIVGFFASIKSFIIKKKPYIMNGCINCKQCAGICPANAITFTDKAQINYDKCIRCYCCHEICPVSEIGVKKGLFR